MVATRKTQLIREINDLVNEQDSIKKNVTTQISLTNSLSQVRDFYFKMRKEFIAANDNINTISANETEDNSETDKPVLNNNQLHAEIENICSIIANLPQASPVNLLSVFGVFGEGHSPANTQDVDVTIDTVESGSYQK